MLPVTSGMRLRPNDTNSTEKASESLARPAIPIPSAESLAVGNTLNDTGPSIRGGRPVAVSIRRASSARIASADRKRGRAASPVAVRATRATMAMMSFFRAGLRCSPVSDFFWGASAPAEQSLDIGELQLDIGRSAVIALAGIGRRLDLTQEGVHLGRFQPPPRS